MGNQWATPLFTARDTSRELARLLPPGTLVYLAVPYDVCTETRLKCHLALRLSRAAPPPPPGTYWLVDDNRQDVIGPDASSCLHEPDGRPIATVSRVAAFRVRRGPTLESWVLYQLLGLGEAACPASESVDG
jgi:hypothetical protein